MREEDRNDIRNLPLFRNMTSPCFDALIHAAYDQVFPAQLELIRQGEVANFLHVVLEGAVELYANWQDRDTTMAVVQPVATFILAACMRDAPYLRSEERRVGKECIAPWRTSQAQRMDARHSHF